MKILITGGHGIVGSYLVEKLSNRHEIFSPNKVGLDLTSYESTKDFFDKHQHFDVVIHGAIKGGSRLAEDAWSVMEDNIKMYKNLLEHSSKFNKLINLSSGAEEYFRDTPYGLSKHVIAKSVESRENYYNIRIFSLFGGNEEETRYIRASLEKYVAKDNFLIHKDKYMDFFHVDDLVIILEHYLNNDSLPKQLDCCYSNAKLRLTDIAEKINDLSNHKSAIRILHPSYFTLEEYIGDSSVLEDLNLPLIGFDKALKSEYEKYQLRNKL
jgi:nucleoside-diphosphate-sugar epimerase